MTQENNSTNCKELPFESLHTLEIASKTPKTLSCELQDNTTTKNIKQNFICSAKRIDNMSSIGGMNKPKEDVLAARQAKKSAKQKSGKKSSDKDTAQPVLPPPANQTSKLETSDVENTRNSETIKDTSKVSCSSVKTDILINKDLDEVDRAVTTEFEVKGDVNKDQIKAERAAKKAAKQAKKKGVASNPTDEISITHSSDTKISEDTSVDKTKPCIIAETKKVDKAKPNIITESKTVSKPNITSENKAAAIIGDGSLSDATVKEMVETLKDIVNVAKDVQSVTDKVKAISIGTKKVD